MENMVQRFVAGRATAPRKMVAVDVGCGDAPYRRLLEPYVARYVGVDLDTNAAADLHFESGPFRIPLPDGFADVVISTQVLEHVERPDEYLREARRVLGPGGLMIVSTHGYWMDHPSPRDYWRWTAEGLRTALESSGWEVLELNGVLGFAAAAIQLLQDALAENVPASVRGPFVFFTQCLVDLVDRRYSAQGRRSNAAVYVVAATPTRAPREI